MSPLLSMITSADPAWTAPLLRLLPAAVLAVALDRLLLALASRRGGTGGRVRRPWLTSAVGNLLGWLAVALLMPVTIDALHAVPGAVTANPVKQWYLHLRLRSGHDALWLAGATMLPALTMFGSAWASGRRRPSTWLLPGFAASELGAMLAAAGVARLLA